MQPSVSIQACAERSDALADEIKVPIGPDAVLMNDPDELEKLFPDPQVRQLLHEIAGDLQSVAKFVKRIEKELRAEKAFVSETTT